MRALLAPLALLLAAPLVAQQQPPAALPGRPDASRVAAGSYKVEPEHTQVLWSVDHLGFNPYFGTFSRVTGTLAIDPARPSAATLDISIPVASVQTTSAKLDEEIVAPMFLDAAKFPTMRFRSTNVEVRGTAARVTGELTLHGVTKPVTMEVLFQGAGPAPMSNVTTIGFQGRARLNRSDFGVAYGVPFVSDEVTIIITAAFEKAG